MKLGATEKIEMCNRCDRCVNLRKLHSDFFDGKYIVGPFEDLVRIEYIEDQTNCLSNIIKDTILEQRNILKKDVIDMVELLDEYAPRSDYLEYLNILDIIDEEIDACDV